MTVSLWCLVSSFKIIDTSLASMLYDHINITFQNTVKKKIFQGSHRLEKYLNLEGFLEKSLKIKGIYYCPIEIIKGLTDKYLIKLKGSQVGNYLYPTQFLSQR